MPRVYIDRVDTIACSERDGVVRSLTNKALVLGLSAGTAGTALLAALAEAQVPKHGDVLLGFPELRMIERSTKVLESGLAADVTLQYLHVMDGPNQSLTAPGQSGGVIYGRTRACVQQKTTNFYTDLDTGEKKQVTVKHTFPEDDPDPEMRGREVEQGGEISVYLPQRNMTFEGYMDTFSPWVVANQLIASVNKNHWCNHPKHEWMCTEVAWERIRTGRYKFGFEFQHNPDTWNPTAVFIDERTGSPPAGLVENEGYKYIRYHKEVNYNMAFNAFFEGWQEVA